MEYPGKAPSRRARNKNQNRARREEVQTEEIRPWRRGTGMEVVSPTGRWRWTTSPISESSWTCTRFEGLRCRRGERGRLESLRAWGFEEPGRVPPDAGGTGREEGVAICDTGFSDAPVSCLAPVLGGEILEGFGAVAKKALRSQICSGTELGDWDWLWVYGRRDAAWGAFTTLMEELLSRPTEWIKECAEDMLKRTLLASALKRR